MCKGRVFVGKSLAVTKVPEANWNSAAIVLLGQYAIRALMDIFKNTKVSQARRNCRPFNIKEFLFSEKDSTPLAYEQTKEKSLIFVSKRSQKR